MYQCKTCMNGKSEECYVNLLTMNTMNQMECLETMIQMERQIMEHEKSSEISSFRHPRHLITVYIMEEVSESPIDGRKSDLD